MDYADLDSFLNKDETAAEEEDGKKVAEAREDLHKGILRENLEGFDDV